MSELEALSPKEYEDYLNQLGSEMNNQNTNDLKEVVGLYKKIIAVHSNISHKIENGKDLSFAEQKFYYESTSKEFKNGLITNLSFKDYIFKDVYNTYLTYSNFLIETTADSQLNTIAIRDFFNIPWNLN
jgi:hypothetical protein